MTCEKGIIMSLWLRFVCFVDTRLGINNRCKICRADLREINRCGTCGEGLEDWPFKPLERPAIEGRMSRQARVSGE